MRLSRPLSPIFVAVLALALAAGIVEGNQDEFVKAAKRRQKSALDQEINRNKTILRQQLLDGYSRAVPPAGGAQVAIQIALYSIVEVSTSRQTIQIQGWWRHYWSDNRLVWDEKLWGVDSLVFDWEDIWRPDNLVYELIEEMTVGVSALTIYPSGSAFYSAPRVSTIRCKMDLFAYPYDTQMCDFTVGSMNYDASLVDIVPRSVDGTTWFEEREGQEPQMKTAIDLTDYKTNSEFSLRRVRVTSKNNYYSCCPFPYPVVKFDFVIERQTTTFMTGILVPIICVTLVGFAVLLTPSPLSGARPTISVSVMFTTSAIYLVAARKMPDLGRLTLVGRLYIASLLSSLLMIFISILTTGINLVVSEENSNRADLLTMFRHYDSDKSGCLDSEEAQKALNALGLSKRDRDQLLRECEVSAEEGFSLDEWLMLGDAARRLRPTTQYNIIIGWFLRLLKNWTSPQQKRSRVSATPTKRTSPLPPPSRNPPIPTTHAAPQHHEQPPNPPVPMATLQRVDSMDPILNEGTAEAPADSLIEKWLTKLGYGQEVVHRFMEEFIDAGALAALSYEHVAQLGVKKIGHQAKLITWAREALPKSQRRASIRMGWGGGSDAEAAKLAARNHSVDTEPPMMNAAERENSRHDLFHVVSVVDPSSDSTYSSSNDGGSKNGGSRVKHLGAWIDFYSFMVFPLLFLLYLLLEFGGAIIGRSIEWNPVPSDLVQTVIELVDERAGEIGEQICFANYQALSSGASEVVCEVPSSMK